MASLLKTIRSHLSIPLLLGGVFLIFFLRLLAARWEWRLVEADADLSVIDLIRRWGYPAESIDITTRDGYVLEMHRIPHGINQVERTDRKPRPVVLMMHGLHGSSYNWIINLPHQSPGYIFADAGYDVWLGNCRGSIHGQRHRELSSWGHTFWDFSWQEMADEDLPAIVDHILNATGTDSLYYMGHSQGFALITAYLSSNPSYNDKIKAAFGVAPVWVNHHSWGPAVVASYKMPVYEQLYKLFGSRQYHAKTSTMISTAFKYSCSLPLVSYACGFILDICGGMPTRQMNYTRTSVYMASTPGGSSTKNMVHWAQICHRGTNLKYDYGERRNMDRYGQAHPPAYNLSNVETPVYLYWSMEDWIAANLDITLNLIDKLSDGVVKEKNVVPNFNHFDFVFGLDAAKEIYEPIVRTIMRLDGEEVEEEEEEMVERRKEDGDNLCAHSAMERFYSSWSNSSLTPRHCR